jgi:MoxR-like ATPase
MQNKLTALYKNIHKEIIGQEELITDLLTCLLAGGHVLIEGMPGLAKTKAAEALAKSINSDFKRIQFTPDLLPSDLIGTDIYIEKQGVFEFNSGPLFANIILADEINRAPAKVQSALLEAMAERQVSVGKKTYKLSDLFFVIATQNPIEQSGTYELPEAQLDRFLMHLKVDYPSKEEELKILDLIEEGTSHKKLTSVIEQQELLDMRKEVESIFIDPKLKQYIADITTATRDISKYDSKLSQYIKYGVSPRASISLMQAAKARAFINGEKNVLPSHIQDVAIKILRHRLILSYNAEADSISSEEIIKKILSLIIL